MVTKKQKEVEKKIKKLVHRYKDKYSNIAIGFLIAEMVIKTNSAEQRSVDLRYKKIMDTIFGKPKELPVGEKDEELLIDAGLHFYCLKFNDEEIYKRYKGQASPEAKACREAVKSYIHTLHYDIVDGHQQFTKKHRSEINKISQRITPKFENKRDHYVRLAIENEARNYAYTLISEDGAVIEKPYGDNEFEEHDIQAYLDANQEALNDELSLISICRTKIINSPDFNYLWSKILAES